MNKSLFKKVRVILNPHEKSFEVEYKKWYSFVWTFDSRIKFYSEGEGSSMTYGSPIWNRQEARDRAVERAQNLIERRVVFQSTNMDFYG